jgi:hypothetical protein
MGGFRKWIGTGLRRLTERLADLGDMLVSINGRLKEAVADAVSHVVADAANDAMFRVLDRLHNVDPAPNPGKSIVRRWRRDDEDDEDEDLFDPDDDNRRPQALAPERSRGHPFLWAVAAGLQAASWLLPRHQERGGLWKIGVLSTLAGIVAFAVPGFSAACLGLAHAASHFGMVSDVFRFFGLS